MTIALSGVKKFAGAHRPVQGAKGQMPSLSGEFARLFCQPAKSSAVALEHQGAGKRTMPAPPRKLNVNPNTGGHVNFSHKLRAEAGAASQWFPRIFSISRAIGRATCKRISRKGGRGESPEQSWDGREVAFAPAHLAPSNKPSRDLNHCMEPRPSAACEKDLESFCLTHQVATGSGGPGDNPIRPGLLSRTPAVPPRPLKATADDIDSGVIQAEKSQHHKLFSTIRPLTRGAGMLRLRRRWAV